MDQASIEAMDLTVAAADDSVEAVATGAPENIVFITSTAHGNTLLETDRQGEYSLKIEDFRSLLPRDRLGTGCYIFVVGMSAQGDPAVHDPLTVKLFKKVTNDYITPILISNLSKDDKISQIKGILPEFLIGYETLIWEELKILLTNASSKLNGYLHEYIFDTSKTINKFKTKEDRFTAKDLPLLMNDIKGKSEELKDLLNVFGRCLFDPKHLISCVLIDERYPLIYEKLISTDEDLLNEDRASHSWDMTVVDTSHELFGWFGNSQVTDVVFPKLKGQSNDDFKIINKDLFRRVFSAKDKTGKYKTDSLAFYDSSCSTLTVINGKNIRNISESSVVNEIQSETDELFKENIITMDDVQVNTIAKHAEDLLDNDPDFIKSLLEAVITLNEIKYIPEDTEKIKGNMPDSFQKQLTKGNIAHMTSNEKGFVFSDQLINYLKKKLIKTGLSRQSSIIASHSINTLSAVGIPHRAATMDQNPAMKRKIVDRNVISEIELQRAIQSLKKTKTLDAGGSRHKRSRRRKHGSKKRIRNRARKTKKRGCRRTKKRIRK